MKRRSKAGGGPIIGRRRKTPGPKRGNAPKGQARPRPVPNALITDDAVNGHPRLSAIKLNKDPVDPALRQEASLEKLRAQMLKHWERVAPVLDLEALVAPSDGIANREVQEG